MAGRVSGGRDLRFEAGELQVQGPLARGADKLITILVKDAETTLTIKQAFEAGFPRGIVVLSPIARTGLRYLIRTSDALEILVIPRIDLHDVPGLDERRDVTAIPFSRVAGL